MVFTEEERRERKRNYNKKYRKSEKNKKCQKKYRESEKGKEFINSKKNKEKKRKLQKKYRETEKGKKIEMESKWKSRGLNMENFEEIYNRYSMAIFCDICECVLDGNGRNKKCMDHCHDTGEFRNIVCSYCNLHICK
jgi:hypothetical protein